MYRYLKLNMSYKWLSHTIASYTVSVKNKAQFAGAVEAAWDVGAHLLAASIVLKALVHI